MKSFFKKYTTLILISIGIFTFSAIKAEAAGNIYGYAWSDGIGWISVNCDQTPAGGQDLCSNSEYGVTLDDSSGYLEGYGWSDHAGWIKFNANGPYPSYVANRIGSARVVGIGFRSPATLTGWMRFCGDFNSASTPDSCGDTDNNVDTTNGGWNGWVSTLGNGADGLPVYGITYNVDTGFFGGYAWGGTANSTGSEVVGWIDFQGVFYEKAIQPSNIPVVQIDAVSPVIQSGGTADIKYFLQSPGINPIVNCTPFVTNGATGVFGPASLANWNSATFSNNALPAVTANTINWVEAFAPSTTYYLLCKTSGGEVAAHPSTPTIPCDVTNQTKADQTCPRTKVAVATTSKYLELMVKGPSQSTFVTGTIQVNPSETVSLQWTTPGPTNMQNCQAHSDTNIWSFGISNPDLISPTFSKIDPVVSVVYPTTTYQIECTDMSDGSQAWSNPVTVNVKNGGQNPKLTLEVSLAGQNNYLSSTTVNPGESIDLKWYSTEIMANCRSSTAGTYGGNVSDWNGLEAGLSAPSFTRIKSSVSVPAPSGSSITYIIQCVDPAGNRVSSSVDVAVGQTNPTESLDLIITLSGDPFTPGVDTVYVPTGVNVDLQWTSVGNLTNCVASSSPVGYFTGSLNPNGTRQNLNLDRTTTPSIITTRYTVTCDSQINGQITDSAWATPLPPNQNTPSVSLSGISCVEDETVNFNNLRWITQNISGGTCTLTNSSGQIGWLGTFSIANDNINNAPTHNLNIPISPGYVDFNIVCSVNGTTTPIQTKRVSIDPTCNQSPRGSWFFKFFER